MRLEEIKAIARERGIRIKNMKKRELIDAILMTGNNGNEKQEESLDSGERAGMKNTSCNVPGTPVLSPFAS